MDNEERILELGQQIYRAMNKTANQNIQGQDRAMFIDDTIDWVNQFLPELEVETYWNFSRTNDDTIGVAQGDAEYILPEHIRTLVISPFRSLTIKHDGSTVSTFRLVNPNQVYDPSDLDTRDRVALAGRRLLFSRPFREEEISGDIVADSIAYIPRLSRDDVSLLDTVDPLQLVVLGTAKNWILPDKVSGNLSPSFTQKYANLLEMCKAENNLTSDASTMPREDFSFIGGVGW